ncbi:hypothetical protein OC835_002107 [Tilletia horrida]|nr:hypothetical protein OC835_002107 [Tilletia horrida]
MSDPLLSPAYKAGAATGATTSPAPASASALSSSSSSSSSSLSSSSASPSPLPSPSPSPARPPAGSSSSVHIRFQDEVPSTITGPLIEVSDTDDDIASSSEQHDQQQERNQDPHHDQQESRGKDKMSVMREQRNYGAMLSVQHAGEQGSSSASASASANSSRDHSPAQRHLSPGAASSPGAAAAAPNAGGGKRAFSFKKRAPSVGAASVAGSHSPSGVRGRSSTNAAAPRPLLPNGARKLLNRASLGFFGNRSPLALEDDAAPLSSSYDAGAGAGAGDSGYGAAGGPGAGARGRWRHLRRTQTLSVHQANLGEGALSPLNPDAYDDDGYGYGHGHGNGGAGDEDKPRIPQMLPTHKPDPDSTPIPALPFVVLNVMIFGEFSSAGVAGPFLFFMINGFGVGGKAEVGFWAGIVSAVFFFAQFLTSMLWASVATAHGRRVVLFVSLAGNCISTILFGTCTNLKMAIAVRLTQGLFNGAVGVAKGAVRDLTDPTNEARAYGMMGFWWGMGGIIGPILGGLLEHPVEKYPAIFGGSTLLAEYPYLLPCLVTACSTGLGAILSLFIGRDGGPRSGTIVLPEKDTERAAATAGVQGRVVRTAAANVSSFGRSAGKRISGYFSNRGGAGGGAGAGPSNLAGAVGDESVHGPDDESNIVLERTAHGKDFPRTFTQQRDWETGGPPSPAASDVTIMTRNNQAMDSGFDNRSIVSRAFSRTSARRQSVAAGGGSAYGYARRQSRSSQLGGPGRFGPAYGRRDLSAAPSAAQSGIRERGPQLSVYAPDFEDLAAGQSGLSFAQRFLLANDDAVLSLTDLWVAAAIGEDGVNALDENVFYDEDGEEYDDGEGITDEDDVDEEAISAGTAEDRTFSDEDEEDGSGIGPSSGRAFTSTFNDATEDSPLLARRPLVPAHFAHRKLSLAGRSDAGASSSAFSTGTRRSQVAGAGAGAGAGGAAAGGSRHRGRGGVARRGRSGSASTAGGGRVPLLYAQAGVEIPHGVSPGLSPAFEHRPPPSGAGSYFPTVPTTSTDSQFDGSASNFNPALAGIPESHSVRNSLHGGGGAGQAPQLSTLREGAATSAFSRMSHAQGGASAVSAAGAAQVVPQSVWALLPLAIVAHYGVLSWHSSTFDQVFMAFLVTDVPSGGLGLTAAHYAELIAAMAVCQMVFQFHVYPSVGPPRGKYTHLAMLRMGLAIYLPCYTLFPWLRGFITSTDITVMSGMILFAALRLLANVTAFTASTVLMNAMTPPHLIPLTNGLAQTVSSFMRCVGPIVGGIVWAQSIEGGPDAHQWPFNYHLGFWVVGIVGFVGFLHSLTIR